MTYVYYKKPTWKIYVSDRRHEQSLDLRFSIALLKEAADYRYFKWVGTSSQIFGARWDGVLKPYVTDLIDLEWNVPLFLMLYERLLFKGKTSFIISDQSIFAIFIQLSSQLQEYVYFCDTLKRNYQFLEASHIMIYCH